MIDGYGGETASDLPLLKNINLDLGTKVLPQKMGRGAASYTGSNHRCSTDDSQPRTEKGVKRLLFESEICFKSTDSKFKNTVSAMSNLWVKGLCLPVGTFRQTPDRQLIIDDSLLSVGDGEN